MEGKNIQNIITNIFVKVAQELGKGYSETVYQEAICVCLRTENISYSKESIHPVFFQGNVVGSVRSDILLNKELIVIECKAIDSSLKLNNVNQVIKYLELTGYKTGFLVNFNQNIQKPLLELIPVYKLESGEFQCLYETKKYIINSQGILQYILE